MKNFFQLREELNQLNELKSDPRDHEILKTGIGSRAGHSGHEGAMYYHDDAADQHKGTEAGKHHAAAAKHHANAVSALNKGNLSSSLEHSKLAYAAARKAQRAGGESSDSGNLHKHHEIIHKNHQIDVNRQAASIVQAKRTKTDKPIQRKIGQTVTKIKRKIKNALRREDVEQIDELKIGTYQNYIKKANQQIKKSYTKKYQDHLDKHGVTPDGKTRQQDYRRIDNRERGVDQAMTGVNRKRAATGKNPQRYITKAIYKDILDKMPKKRGRPRSLSYGYSKPEV